jgi:hypothetical protein
MIAKTDRDSGGGSSWSAACTAKRSVKERKAIEGAEMKVRALVCALLLAVWGSQAAAGDKITLKASPAISFAPAHLFVSTNIEADPANRELEIVAESPDFFRSSVIELDGDRAPRTSTVEFASLPGGVYDVTARLLGPNREVRGYAHRMINVLASGER